MLARQATVPADVFSEAFARLQRHVAFHVLRQVVANDLSRARRVRHSYKKK
jgi:hypothetical protein